MSTLVLIRHGTTEWAAQNRFAGWADAPLSDAGRDEARRAGQALSDKGYLFDLCYTSRLSRARETLEIVLEVLHQGDTERRESWRLNERHYGVLQGMNRTKAALEFGNKKIGQWRRDFQARPPATSRDSPHHPANDPRYRDVDPTTLPDTESMRDAASRVLPWWETELAPILRSDAQVLIIAHTASIRGLVRHIEALSDDESEAFRIATCVPLVYRFSGDLADVEKEELLTGFSSRVRRFFNKHKPGRSVSWI